VARFSNEARSAAKIQSEHVARVLDVGVLDDGSPYMVMEYLEGTDLAGLIKQRGSIPGPEAIEYVLQACEALAEAHVAGIVHRDLKPANLFLTRRADGSPSVKVLDFGISKAALSNDGAGQALTQTAAVLGSPSYMAPEQLKSARQADPRTDIWALGIILHELMTGACAFQADTVPELYVSILQAPPTALRQRLPNAPPALEAVLLRCLEKDPARRYASVGELALALAEFAPTRAQPSVERVATITGAVRATRHASPRVNTPQPQHGGVAPTIGPAHAGVGGSRGPYGAPPQATHAQSPGYAMAPQYAPQPTPQHHPQAPYAMVHPASKGMAPATLILIILVAVIVFGASGCMLCVCVSAANSGNSRHGARDLPGPGGLVPSALSRIPFQPPAGWTSVARGEPHRLPHPAEQSALFARWDQKRSRTSAHIAHSGGWSQKRSHPPAHTTPLS
jgi:serine/threonine-protein kinase